LQDLANCAVYTITVGSAVTPHPIAIQLHSGVPLDLGQVNVAPGIADDFGPVTQAVGDVIDLGALAATAHPIAAALGIGNVDLGTVPSAITASDDFGAVVDPPIHATNLGTVP
jgi:hypothetical protein